MKEILGIYIVDEHQDIIFLYEIFRDITEVKQALFANFLIANFHNITEDLKDLTRNSMSIGNSKVYWAKDKSSNIIFIVRCRKSAKEKEILTYLEKIKTSFLDIFAGNLQDSEDKMYELKIKFEKRLRAMFKNTSDAVNFLKSI